VIAVKPEMFSELRNECGCEDEEEATSCAERIARLECIVVCLLEKNERLRQQLVASGLRF
jgi:hypothetical protein